MKRASILAPAFSALSNLAFGAVMVAVSGAFFGAAAESRSAAHEFCAMQWASDKARMSQCVARQIDGARSIVRYLDWAKASPGPDGEHVVETFEFCRLRWSPDFYRVDTCLRARALISPP